MIKNIIVSITVGKKKKRKKLLTFSMIAMLLTLNQLSFHCQSVQLSRIVQHFLVGVKNEKKLEKKILEQSCLSFITKAAHKYILHTCTFDKQTQMHAYIRINKSTHTNALIIVWLLHEHWLSSMLFGQVCVKYKKRVF